MTKATTIPAREASTIRSDIITVRFMGNFVLSDPLRPSFRTASYKAMQLETLVRDPGAVAIGSLRTNTPVVWHVFLAMVLLHMRHPRSLKQRTRLMEEW